MREVILTRDDVIRIFRGYRRAAMIVMEGYVTLDFDVENKEILIFKALNSERYTFVLTKERYIKQDILNKASASAWMRVVHEWLTLLENDEAACVFYKYICGERWSYSEIGARLGIAWWQVQRKCATAISKILRYNRIMCQKLEKERVNNNAEFQIQKEGEV